MEALIVSIFATTVPSAMAVVQQEVSSWPPTSRSLGAVPWHRGKWLVTTTPCLALHCENTDLSSELGVRC